MTSSLAPAISAQLVWNPEVKSSSFSVRENQSLLGPPPFLQTIPDSVPADVKLLLQKRSTILRTGDVLPRLSMALNITFIPVATPPPRLKSRRLDPQNLKIAKAEFKRLESAGIIHRSKSPWASPLQMVPKKDVSWRPCHDYCRLNLITTSDKYPLPNMQYLSSVPEPCPSS
jgi:hypothetical protein